MSSTEICPGCFAPRGHTVVCPRCGFDETVQPVTFALPYRSMLDNCFLVGRVLGKPGGFGITYLGWDTRLQTRVAIKEYLPRHLVVREMNKSNVSVQSKEDREFFDWGLDRFLQEARILAMFSHLNIVRVRAFFLQNETGYLVMDYYEGMTLGAFVQRHGGRIDPPTAIGIMIPILDGLRQVHSKGFLHRDIKPQNIYITNDNRPILLDFGAARYAMGERSHNLSVVVTPGFVPYEQYHARGRQGPWTDIYACGGTLYQIITGRTPPDAIERANRDELQRPSTLVPEIPPDFDDAIIKALAMDPQDRFQDVQELQSVLLGAKGENRTPTARLEPEVETVPESTPGLRTKPQPEVAPVQASGSWQEPELKPETAPDLRAASEQWTRPIPKPRSRLWAVVGGTILSVLLVLCIFLVGKERPLPVHTVTEGALSIDSQPTGADWYIDGKYQGKTPVHAPFPVGTYLIKVEKAGYRAWQGQVTVKPGEMASLGTVLAPVEAPAEPPLRASVTQTQPAVAPAPANNENIPPPGEVTTAEESASQPREVASLPTSSPSTNKTTQVPVTAPEPTLTPTPRKEGAPAYFRVVNVARNDVLNIRAEPDHRSLEVGEIPPDGTCIVGFEQTASLVGSFTWRRIEYLSATGWVNARFLRPVENPAQCSSTSTPSSEASSPPPLPRFLRVVNVASNDVLNIREEPDWKSRKSGEIPWDGKCVVDLDESREMVNGSVWKKIRYGTTEGWVNTMYLTQSQGCN